MTMFAALMLLSAVCAGVLASDQRMNLENILMQPLDFFDFILKEGIGRERILLHFRETEKLKLFPDSRENLPTISSQCSAALGYLLTHPTSDYAKTISDASAKEPSGLTEGAVHWVGNFDQCFANLPPADYSSANALRSHYCQLPVAFWSKSSKVVFYIGVCAPDTCSAKDVASYTNRSFIGKFYVRSGSYCWKRQEDIRLSRGAITMMWICGITVFLVLLSTTFDAVLRRTSNAAAAAHEGDLDERYHRFGDEMVRFEDDVSSTADEMHARAGAADRSTEIWKGLLLSFSTITNLETLCDTSAKAGRLGCLDGIRFLSMAWIILGHSFAFLVVNLTSPLGVLNNFLYFDKLLRHWSFQTISNGSFSVDTFFVLSGILTSYYFLKEADVISTINSMKFWGFFFLHRFLRLTPVYILCIGFFTFLVKYFSTGPFWNQTNFFNSENCITNWWTNLLYVNNFVRPTQMCMAWSWFLAIDMQLHLFIATILLPTFFFCRLFSRSHTRFDRALFSAVFFPICAVLVSVISSGWIYKADLDNKKTATEIFNDYYIAPWCRMSPYIVGLAVGFLILIHEKRNFKLHPLLVMLGWIVSAGLCLSVLYGLSGVAAGTYKNSNAVTALYWALGRFSWALGVSWVIFACRSGNAGWIDAFLSWRGFAPLSRLTYCAYLTHPVVIAVVYSSLRQAQVLSTFGVVCFFLTQLVLTYVVALVVSLSWEAPFRVIERSLLRRS